MAEPPEANKGAMGLSSGCTKTKKKRVNRGQLSIHLSSLFRQENSNYLKTDCSYPISSIPGRKNNVNDNFYYKIDYNYGRNCGSKNRGGPKGDI